MAGLRRVVLAALVLAARSSAWTPFLSARHSFQRHQPPNLLRQALAALRMSTDGEPLRERLASLRGRVADAKAQLQSSQSAEAEEELRAAEEALFAFELNNPEEAMTAAISVKRTEASIRGGAAASEEAWRWEKLEEKDAKLAEAERVLAEAALQASNSTDRWLRNGKVWNGRTWQQVDEETLRAATAAADTASSRGQSRISWQQVAGAIAECGYWALQGSPRAELALLKQLTEREGSWVAREADMALRKAWGASGNTLVDASMDAARAFLVAGNRDSALAQYERVVSELATVWPEGWFRRGLCLQIAFGNRTAAAESYRTALELNPRHYPSLLALGKLMLAATEETADGDVERARDVLREASRLNPLLRDEVAALLDDSST